MEIFREIIRSGDLCFDIGANLGNKTQEMSDLGSFVVSIEPQIDCYAHLKNRFANNPNVTIVNYACGSSNRKDIMNISSAHTLSTMSDSFIKETSKERFTGTSWDKKIEIELVTLDSLINIYGVPRFCKIDVEGYEVEVLKGLSHPIPFISLEFVPELKKNSFECIDSLLKIGEYVFNYSEGESGFFEFSNWINSKDIINYLLEKNDFKNSFGDIYAKKKEML
jgi:FkbM family methyltransferase